MKFGWGSQDEGGVGKCCCNQRFLGLVINFGGVGPGVEIKGGPVEFGLLQNSEVGDVGGGLSQEMTKAKCDEVGVLKNYVSWGAEVFLTATLFFRVGGGWRQ